MSDYDDDEILWYCTECMSLDIRDDENGHPYCHHCGAEAKDLDFADNIWTWMRLYAKKYKKSPLEYHTKYDDLREIYEEETEYIASEADAYNSGLVCRDVININWNRIDK